MEQTGSLGPPKTEKFDEKCTILMLGNQAVGKSSIVKAFKFESDHTHEHAPTFGFDFFRKIVNIDQKLIKAIVYDTSGQERFMTISKNYIRSGDGIIIVYDITCRESFDDIAKWFTLIDEIRGSTDLPIIIVGNKIDLEEQRSVSTQEGEKLAEEYD